MLNARVLVLNRNFQPVRVTNARRALCMLYIGSARALNADYQQFDFLSWSALSAEFNDDWVGTTNRRLRIPRIVVLQVYDRVPIGRIRFSRQNIFLRDHNTCQYCRQELDRRLLNLDHVVPRSQGGKTTWENVVASCFGCNHKKGGRTPQQARMQLFRQPRKPRWSELATPKPKVMYREWIPFLDPVDATYWNTELESDETE